MSLLTRLFTSISKRQKALEEDVNLLKYIEPEALKVKIQNVPFRHVVIDNFFTPDFLKSLTGYYHEILTKGISDKETDLDKFHPFEEKINYDGFVFSPEPTLEEPLKLFFSVEWNMFFSRLFNKPTTFGTSFALHYHPPHDRTGWVHNDYATYLFPHKLILSNGVTGTRGEEGKTKLTDAELRVRNFKQKRTIAIIYYFNNPEWSEGDGGETGLYSAKDEKALVKKIEPINNRLFAFDISPESFHAFQENFKERNTLIQWFHADLDWSEEKYGFL